MCLNFAGTGSPYLLCNLFSSFQRYGSPSYFQSLFCQVRRWIQCRCGSASDQHSIHWPCPYCSTMPRRWVQGFPLTVFIDRALIVVPCLEGEYRGCLYIFSPDTHRTYHVFNPHMIQVHPKIHRTSNINSYEYYVLKAYSHISYRGCSQKLQNLNFFCLSLKLSSEKHVSPKELSRNHFLMNWEPFLA